MDLFLCYNYKGDNMKKNKLFLIVLIVIFVAIISIIYFLYRYNIIEHKSFNNSDFGIDTYISDIDKDGDGIDDQTDILKSVREYTLTNPKYKSKYYSTGYPDDNYGVCTDVVGVGLLNAGYNLMELVNEDIINNRDLYDIDIVDKNIDFRRVRNLYIYFERKAIKLTNDIYDIDKWQGGDIIIFKNHIAIISDKRNKNGVPFIIHNYGLFQFRYEEDILEYREDIIGHYRIS